MRIRFGAAMPSKGGRTAVVGVEVRDARDPSGRLVHQFTVGAIERVTPFTVEAARDRVVSMMTSVADTRPCAIVDVGTPQGMALRQALVGAYSRDLHKPHAYLGGTARNFLFSAFLQAYADGRVRFEPGLQYRADLDRALVFYLGGGVRKDGFDLESEDEALVVALGLAMFWPRHGAQARQFVPAKTLDTVAAKA